MQALRFKGRGSEYFGIWIVNILLTIVTLSIYYPWAKVRNRRYFLGNTTLEGRSFDYHATGKQLLPGYLISLVLVLVFVLVQNVFPSAGFALFGVLLLGGPWIVWKSLGFNMRMTSFSNVRFGFAGTVGGAYLSYLVWPAMLFACLLIGPMVVGALAGSGSFGNMTLALLATAVVVAAYALAFFLYARVKQRQTQYVINGYRYGQGHFTTTVKIGGFAEILLKTIGLSLLMLIALIAVVAAIATITDMGGGLMDLVGSMNDSEAPDSETLADAVEAGLALLLVALYLGFLACSMLLASYFHTRQRAYILSQSTLDGRMRFASTLGARRYAWVLLSNLLLVVLTLGLGIPWARTRMARVLAEHTEVETDAGFDDYVGSKQAEQSSLGEQIGDAFDVDVGVGF